MEIQISAEKQQFTMEKINQLEHRMRCGKIEVDPSRPKTKKKIEPIMVQQNTTATVQGLQRSRTEVVREADLSNKENHLSRQEKLLGDQNRNSKSEEKFVRKPQLQ